MIKHELGETLARLKSELEKVDGIDESARGLLEKIDGDIHRILGAPETIPPEHHRTLRENLEIAAGRFEVTHPTLSVLMSRLIKTLGDMGI